MGGSMSVEMVRPEVVEALITAYGKDPAWAAVAAVTFELQPPPTDAEKGEARAVFLRRRAAEYQAMVPKDDLPGA